MQTARKLSNAFGAASCAVLILAGHAHANDALDFWRQEWARQNGQQDWGQNRQSDWNRQSGWTQSQPAPARSPGLRLTVRPRREASVGIPNGRRYCVRTCDGYYFPLTPGNGASEAEQCSALCPDTATEVFRAPSGDESIDRAVSTKGKAYTALPAAFAYRTSLKSGCSCGRPASVQTALRKDPTLAPGDVVMTEKGVRVFAGGSFPFKDRDFLPLRKARGLPAALMTYLSLLDRPFRETELKQTLDETTRAARTASVSPGRASDQM